MERLPRGANFQRALMLWQIGLHIAGDPNTPYYVRLGAIFNGATTYSLIAGSTSTLTAPVTPGERAAAEEAPVEKIVSALAPADAGPPVGRGQRHDALCRPQQEREEVRRDLVQLRDAWRPAGRHDARHDLPYHLRGI